MAKEVTYFKSTFSWYSEMQFFKSMSLLLEGEVGVFSDFVIPFCVYRILTFTFLLPSLPSLSSSQWEPCPFNFPLVNSFLQYLPNQPLTHLTRKNVWDLK